MDDTSRRLRGATYETDDVRVIKITEQLQLLDIHCTRYPSITLLDTQACQRYAL